MAIAFGSSGTGASGTTSATPTCPATTTDGELLVAHTVSKYALPDAAPAGWTLAGSISGGHGSSGSNTGTVYVAFYWRIATFVDAGSTAYTWTVTGGNAIRVNISRYTKAIGDTWSVPAFASVANNTPGTSWSATATSNPGISAGDLMVFCAGVNSSAFTYSSPALTATGCTFGAITNRFANQVNTGDHLEPVDYDCTVSTGPASAAPVFTMTVSGSTADAPAGATAFLRLRATTSQVVPYKNRSGLIAGTTTMNVSYPSPIVAGNVLLLAVYGKYPTNYPTTPSGWTPLTTQRSSSGLGNGSDSGDVWIAVYYKIALGTESGTLTVAVPSGNVITGGIYQVTVTAGYVAGVTSTGGSDDTSHTGVSITFGSNLSLSQDDTVMVFLTQNNSLGAQSSARLTATGVANQLTNIEYSQSAGGDKMRTNANQLTVASTGGISGNLTWAMTLGSAGVVAAVAVRITGTVAVGAIAGTSTVTGVGASTAQGAGTSTGASTVTGTGKSTGKGAGTSAGVATVSGTGKATAKSAGSAAGTGTASAAGKATAKAAGSAAGTSTASAASTATGLGTGTATGAATVAGVGVATAKAAGSSSGAATVAGVGKATTVAAGSAAGTSTVAATGKAAGTGAGSSTGTSTVAAAGKSSAIGAGSSAGAATVAGVGKATGLGTGSAAGTSTATGVVPPYTSVAVGTAAGSCDVAGYSVLHVPTRPPVPPRWVAKRRKAIPDRVRVKSRLDR